MSKVTKEFKPGMNLVKDWANTELKKLDWYSTRLVSEGTLVPENVLEYTKKLRTIEEYCIPVVDEAGNLNLKETNLPKLARGDKSKGLLLKLQSLCDSKSREAKTYINGMKATDEQLARYREKYAIAKEYKMNGAYEEQLQLEADLQGMSVNDLADIIIAKGDAYSEALLVFNSRIEAFRIAVTKLIKGSEFEMVETILSKASAMGADATDDEIRELFTR